VTIPRLHAILRPAVVPPFYFFVGAVSAPIVKLVYRLRPTGLDNLPAGGCVLGANHTSNLDPWALAFPLWPRRRVRFMAKIELYKVGLGPLLRGGGAFPVRRGERDREAIETAVELVRSGEIVVMFPEGTRRKKGLRKKFEPRAHTGAARIALSAGAPLVPAAIRGTDRLSRLPQVRVAYGSPIPVDDLARDDVRESARIATERLMQAIEDLYAAL
jgi:1-acyl-sn-glycerol-3-phosphate acyltransferase